LIGGTNVSLDELPARMEAITASLVDIRRFAVNQSGSEPKTVTIPAHIESVRFTLYNSDTAASLEITDPDGNVITIDSPEVSEVSGQGTPIQVWQLNRPPAGRYTVRAQNARRPGIITWLLAYQGISATFDNPPGSFEPGKEGNIQFSLVDSSDTPVLADQDGLDINVSISQLGGETVSQEPTLTDDTYTLSWTPKNSRPAEFTVSLTDPRVNLGLNCSLVFDLISTTPPTDTPTPTPTFTPTVTPTVVTPRPDITPVPVVAILPQCVPAGESVRLPMKLVYSDAKTLPASLKWEVTSANRDINVSVNPTNAKDGAFELRMGPINEKTGPIQLQLKAIDTANGGAAPFFVVDAPPLTVCDAQPPCDCGAPPIWLIFVWLMMWLVLLLLGWVILRDVTIDIKFWLLVSLEIVLAVVWFILFSGYLVYLFWMLLLIVLLILLVFIFRKVIEEISWWLIILVTLFVSIWFVLFGNFPFWLILLLLLMWLGILVLVWIFRTPEPPSWRWWVLVLLLILALVSIIYFSTYWIFLLLWLLTISILTLVVLVIGPICPPIPMPPPPPPADDLKELEGIEGGVEKLLNDHGIYTFRELAKADINALNQWLNDNDWKYMDPKTWPQQAKLADIARRYENPEDIRSYKAYMKWLKNGIEPDEYKDKEKVRRPEALVWRGTAELTEKDHPEIFNVDS